MGNQVYKSLNYAHEFSRERNSEGGRKDPGDAAQRSYLRGRLPSETSMAFELANRRRKEEK
jgi:hypothetical protein